MASAAKSESSAGTARKFWRYFSLPPRRHPKARDHVERALAATKKVGHDLVQSGVVSDDLLEIIKKDLLDCDDFSSNADGWWK